jgi:hypothetical protein
VLRLDAAGGRTDELRIGDSVARVGVGICDQPDGVAYQRRVDRGYLRAGSAVHGWSRYQDRAGVHGVGCVDLPRSR